MPTFLSWIDPKKRNRCLCTGSFLGQCKTDILLWMTSNKLLIRVRFFKNNVTRNRIYFHGRLRHILKDLGGHLMLVTTSILYIIYILHVSVINAVTMQKTTRKFSPLPVTVSVIKKIILSLIYCKALHTACHEGPEREQTYSPILSGHVLAAWPQEEAPVPRERNWVGKSACLDGFLAKRKSLTPTEDRKPVHPASSKCHLHLSVYKAINP